MNYKPYSLRIGEDFMVAGIHSSPMHILRSGNFLTITTDVQMHCGVLRKHQNSGAERIFQIREEVDGDSVTVCAGKLKGASEIHQPWKFNFIVTDFYRQYRQ